MKKLVKRFIGVALCVTIMLSSAAMGFSYERELWCDSGGKFTMSAVPESTERGIWYKGASEAVIPTGTTIVYEPGTNGFYYFNVFRLTNFAEFIAAQEQGLDFQFDDVNEAEVLRTENQKATFTFNEPGFYYIQIGMGIEPDFLLFNVGGETGATAPPEPPAEPTPPTPPTPPVPPSDEIRVRVNGVYVEFDQPPIIENGRTLVPLRAIFEALGAAVDWNNDTQTVTAVKDDITVSLTIGSNILIRNGQSIELDVPAQLVGGRTLVPARAVAESFGATVDWNGETRTVIITE